MAFIEILRQEDDVAIKNLLSNVHLSKAAYILIGCLVLDIVWHHQSMLVVDDARMVCRRTRSTRCRGKLSIHTAYIVVTYFEVQGVDNSRSHRTILQICS
jgi:hypothetical protein